MAENWKTQQWPQDWKRSFFIPVPKKSNAKDVKAAILFQSFHMLAKLCSKSFKLAFSSMRAENFHTCKLSLEKAEEQVIKLPTSVGSWRKLKELQKNIYFCFIDSAKAFDSVDHRKLWEIFKEIGVPVHLTCLLRNLYTGQDATLRIIHGTIDRFKIGKGVCQGCILSPWLFNICRVYHGKC